jgi:hypothetical protein
LIADHNELSEFRIVETGDADYRYRASVDKTAWAAVLERIAQTIDYPNFKSAVAEIDGNNEYCHALHRVWEVMYELQEKMVKKLQ